MPDPTHAAAELRSAGLRATAPRVALLAALREDGSHPGAEQLFRRLAPGQPRLSLSTVYANLELLLGAGLVRRVGPAGSPLRVDGKPDDHDHAICRGCGAVHDLPSTRAARPPLPDALPGGLVPTAVRVEYDVLCASCASRPPAGQPPHNPARE